MMMRTRFSTLAAGLASPLFAVACASSPSGMFPPAGDTNPEPRAEGGLDAGGGEGQDANAAGTGDAGGGEGGHDAGGSDGASEGSSPEGGLGPNALPYMLGIKTNDYTDGPAKVEGWLGRALDLAGTTINTDSYIGVDKPYTNASGGYPLLEVSFPLLSIFGENNNLSDLAQAASGAYDSTYEKMAQALAAWPNKLLSARISWEFNGNWYAWSNGVGTNATYANFVSAFKHAAQAIKKYNPHALIQWCVAWGQPDPTPYWPGAYDAATNPGGVDVISMDFYQSFISQYNNGGKQSTWAMVQSGGGSINLDWMTSFAQQKGVKIALSEYGAGSTSVSKGEESGPGLDDGAWTAASIKWINSQPAGFFLWTNWTDDAPGDDIVTPGANPAEQAAWSAAWKGTSFGGTWWP
jgi:hypothetical protein